MSCHIYKKHISWILIKVWRRTIKWHWRCGGAETGILNTTSRWGARESALKLGISWVRTGVRGTFSRLQLSHWHLLSSIYQKRWKIHLPSKHLPRSWSICSLVSPRWSQGPMARVQVHPIKVCCLVANQKCRVRALLRVAKARWLEAWLWRW